MIEIEYDEMTDRFYYVCDCGSTGRLWDRKRDAEQDADRHDELHDDGVV